MLEFVLLQLDKNAELRCFYHTEKSEIGSRLVEWPAANGDTDGESLYR